MINKSRLDTWHERKYFSVSVKVISPKWLHNNMFRLFNSSSVPILQAKSTILYYLSLLQTEPSSLRLTGKLYMRFLQMNIWNIIYMNCGVRYEDMMFNHVFTWHSYLVLIYMYVIAVLWFFFKFTVAWYKCTSEYMKVHAYIFYLNVSTSVKLSTGLNRIVNWLKFIIIWLVHKMLFSPNVRLRASLKSSSSNFQIRKQYVYQEKPDHYILKLFDNRERC